MTLAKWSELRAKWLEDPLGSDLGQSFDTELAELSSHGIPITHRRWAWPYLLAKERNGKMMSSETTYRNLVIRSRKNADDLKSDIIKQDTSRIKCLTNEQQIILDRILRAYDHRENSIYYCHGMADICSLLLLYMDEETAFWSFVVIVEVLLPGYHLQNMEGFHTDCLVLEDLLTQRLSNLRNHLIELGLSIQVISTKWFLSLFANSLPQDVSLWIFDLLLSRTATGRNASKVIIAIACSIFSHLENEIQRMDDAEEVMNIITRFCSKFLQNRIVSEPFQKICEETLSQLTDEFIQSLRSKYHGVVLSDLKTFQEKKEKIRQDRQSREMDDNDKSLVSSLQNGNTMNEKNSPLVVTSPLLLSIKSPFIEKIIDNDICSAHVLAPCTNEPSPSTYNKTPNRKTSSPSFPMNLSLFNTFQPRHHRSFEYDNVTHLRRKSLTLWDNLYKKSLDQKMWKDKRFFQEVSKLGFYGVPDEHRHWVWSCLLYQHRNMLMQSSNASYADLLGQLETKDTPRLIEIDHDIPRTQVVKEDMWTRLRRVLLAYVNRNETIGYCQGMNELAGAFLKYMDEETSFWSLAVVVEILLPEYHVKSSLIGLHTDCSVILSLLNQLDTNLVNHFQDIGVNMQLICTKWLMTCFVTSVPNECSFSILEMMFSLCNDEIAASRVLLGTILTIFCELSDVLSLQDEVDEVVNIITQYIKLLNVDEARRNFLVKCRKTINEMKMTQIEEFRAFHRRQVTASFTAFEIKKQELRDEQEVQRVFLQQQSIHEDSLKLQKKSSTYQILKNWISSRSISIKTKKKKEFLKNSPPVDQIDKIKNEKPSINAQPCSNVNREKTQTQNLDELLSMGERLRRLSESYREGHISAEEKSLMKEKIIEGCYKGTITPRAHNSIVK